MFGLQRVWRITFEKKFFCIYGLYRIPKLRIKIVAEFLTISYKHSHKNMKSSVVLTNLNSLLEICTEFENFHELIILNQNRTKYFLSEIYFEPGISIIHPHGDSFRTGEIYYTPTWRFRA